MQKLKSIIFQFLIRCVLAEARVLGMLCKRKPGPNARVGVLEPCPTSVDSNGDEALIEGTCRFLNERSSTSVALLSFYDNYAGRLPANTKYGGCLYRHSDSNITKVVRYFYWPLLLARYDELYIIGADLVDGYYDPSVTRFLFVLLRISDVMGVKGNLISCSFNTSPPESVCCAARKLLVGTRVHARDAYSAERFSAVLGRTVTHSSDVAFGLAPEPTEHGREIAAWIRSQESSGRQVIALNINLLPIRRQMPGKEDEYIKRWGRWLIAMTAQGFSFVLIPHDYRDEWSDEIALIKLIEQVLPVTRSFCHIPKGRLHAPEIKYVVGNCLLAVTGRMHLAIAAMGSGVPVIAYAYQSKFEGILRLFGIDRCVRPINGIFDNIDAEVVFALEIVKNVEKMSSMVRSHVDEVLALSRQNISMERITHD